MKACTVGELQILEYFGTYGGMMSGAQQRDVTGYCWWKQAVETVAILVPANPVNGIARIVLNQRPRDCVLDSFWDLHFSS